MPLQRIRLPLTQSGYAVLARLIGIAVVKRIAWQLRAGIPKQSRESSYR